MKVEGSNNFNPIGQRQPVDDAKVLPKGAQHVSAALMGKSINTCHSASSPSPNQEASSVDNAFGGRACITA